MLLLIIIKSLVDIFCVIIPAVSVFTPLLKVFSKNNWLGREKYSRVIFKLHTWCFRNLLVPHLVS